MNIRKIEVVEQLYALNWNHTKSRKNYACGRRVGKITRAGAIDIDSLQDYVNINRLINLSLNVRSQKDKLTMATEKGTVMKADATRAWVKTSRSSACETCASKKSCHSLSGSVEDMEVEAINEVGAKAGDTIVLSMETSSFLKATFLLYVFPILLLLIGAAAGHHAASFIGIDQSAFSAIIGLLLFFAGIGFVKAKGNKLAQRKDYRPKVIKIVKRASYASR